MIQIADDGSNAEPNDLFVFSLCLGQICMNNHSETSNFQTFLPFLFLPPVLDGGLFEICCTCTFFPLQCGLRGGYRARRKGFLSRGRRQHLPTPPPSLIFDPALKLKLLSPALLHQCFQHYEVKINVNEIYLNI